VVVTGVCDGAAAVCCDLAPVGDKIAATVATANPTRKRLVNLLIILLLGFCNT
jgi:hypothetical protein